MKALRLRPGGLFVCPSFRPGKTNLTAGLLNCRGDASSDVVKHLLLCQLEQRPPRLDLENYPHLPPAQVRTTQASEYMALLGEVHQ
jgi:hypothetical protein